MELNSFLLHPFLSSVMVSSPPYRSSFISFSFIHTSFLRACRAFRLINCPPLTDCFQSLKHRRSVASLSIFYRYFHGYCSSELANCMPPPLPRPRCTRLSTFSHPYSIQLTNARVNQYLHSFIPFTGRLWNSLPDSVFPPSYNLDSFKRGVSRHLHR